MDDFLHRKPTVVNGFPEEFQEYLEDLIDSFVPLDSIPKIIKIEYDKDYSDIDYFCKKVYNMDFKDTYHYLFQKADMYCRKAFTNLAKQGNKSAMAIVAEHFMKLGQDEARANAKITINASIPLTDKGNGSLSVGKKDEDED